MHMVGTVTVDNRPGFGHKLFSLHNITAQEAWIIVSDDLFSPSNFYIYIGIFYTHTVLVFLGLQIF